MTTPSSAAAGRLRTGSPSSKPPSVARGRFRAVLAGRFASRETIHLAVPIVAVLVAVICGSTVVQIAAIARPATRSQSWWIGFFAGGAALPFTLMLLAVAVVLLLTIGSSFRWRPVLLDGALISVFTAYCFATRIAVPTGDQPIWRAEALTEDVAVSEPIASVLHKIPYLLTGSEESIGWVSPVFGLLVISTYLLLVREIAGRDRIMGVALRLVFFGTCIPCFFVIGYVENTFLALPAFFLSMTALLRWSRTGSVRHLLLGAGAMGLACATHGSFLVHAAAAGAFVLLAGRSIVRAALGTVVYLAAFVLTVVAVLMAIAAAGFEITPGNTTGGGDNSVFAPFVPGPGVAPGTPLFLSGAHLIQSTDILLAASPLVVPLAGVLAVIAWRRGSLPVLLEETRGSGALPLLALCSLAYSAFVAVWGFDLGVWGDLDLMLVGGVPLAVCAAIIVTRLLRHRETVLYAALLASVIAAMVSYGPRTMPAWLG